MDARQNPKAEQFRNRITVNVRYAPVITAGCIVAGVEEAAHRQDILKILRGTPPQHVNNAARKPAL